MTPDEFKRFCAEDGFDWAEGACPNGEHEGKPGFFVHIPWMDAPGEQECAHVTLEALPTTGWPQIKRFAVAGRDVAHFTRIVGYLSRVENWNQSKIGELRDRHRGQYSVEQTTSST